MMNKREREKEREKEEEIKKLREILQVRCIQSGMNIPYNMIYSISLMNILLINNLYLTLIVFEQNIP